GRSLLIGGALAHAGSLPVRSFASLPCTGDHAQLVTTLIVVHQLRRSPLHLWHHLLLETTGDRTVRVAPHLPACLCNWYPCRSVDGRDELVRARRRAPQGRRPPPSHHPRSPLREFRAHGVVGLPDVEAETPVPLGREHPAHEDLLRAALRQ